MGVLVLCPLWYARVLVNPQKQLGPELRQEFQPQSHPEGGMSNHQRVDDGSRSDSLRFYPQLAWRGSPTVRDLRTSTPKHFLSQRSG